ncbi:MAG: hydroxymethylbilane synthase [bacterium]
MNSPIRIGTRGSALALRQTEQVRSALTRRWRGLQMEIRVFKTTGDRVQGQPLPRVGTQGIFTQELEVALLGGEIDVAVHSLKDLPTEMPAGLTIHAIGERVCPLDALVTREGATLRDLEPGSVIGTSSLRRRAQILHHRPDLRIVNLRGNLDTRLRKVKESGTLDGAILACAGLQRLGLSDEIAEILDSQIMLPSPGQGALAIQGRTNDSEIEKLLAPLECRATRAAVTAERGLMRRLGGGCHIPIGGLGTVDDSVLSLEAGVFTLDGTKTMRQTLTGDPDRAEAVGIELAERLLAEGASEILGTCGQESQDLSWQ